MGSCEVAIDGDVMVGGRYDSLSLKRDTLFIVLGPRCGVLRPLIEICELIKILRNKQNLSQILSRKKEWKRRNSYDLL